MLPLPRFGLCKERSNETHHPLQRKLDLQQARRDRCCGVAAPHMEQCGRARWRQRLLARHRHLLQGLCQTGAERRRALLYRIWRRGHDGGRDPQRRSSCPPRGRLLHLPRRSHRCAGERKPAGGFGGQQRQRPGLPPDGGLHLLRRHLPGREADPCLRSAFRAFEGRHARHQGHAGSASERAGGLCRRRNLACRRQRGLAGDPDRAREGIPQGRNRKRPYLHQHHPEKRASLGRIG